ncbi:DUF2441 domain-containing protein [Kordiimonas pumila]|uniref:DUF2441 domain-containing protein n=1 Tax=Kordiimonas pumila TaxID=2161677 RepID=A0ABV7D8E3_9PROT|nr:DUF2441 domain-containing protein [Kordiimonas pumila]
MNNSIQSGEYFHVVHRKNYIPYEPLQEGDSFSVGTEINPFFRYYEKAREYKVKGPDGPMTVPALRFLADIKHGRIKCPDLPKQALSIANHYNTLARELILEEVRLRINPKAPSRKTCLWVSENLELALIWKKKIIGRSRVMRLRLEGSFHTGDARLMMNESEPLSVAYSKAERYWHGDMSDRPLPETLFSGSATVLEEIKPPKE